MKKVTSEELRKNREHLKYEIDMLCASVSYLLSHTRDRSSLSNSGNNQSSPTIYATTESSAKLIFPPLDSENTEWSINNAVLESFGFHVRSLYNFLYDAVRKKPTDVLALDYFDDEAKWIKNRPVKPNLKNHIERVNTEIAHLTKHRLDKTPESKNWPVLPIAKEIAEPLLRFIELAPSEFVDASVIESLNKIIDLPD